MPTESGHIIPALQYHDAPAAIEWLCRVLGFEKKLVVPTEDGRIAHAQLVQGAGMIMLGSQSDSEYSKHMTIPVDIQGKNTQSTLIFIPDSDIAAHYSKAKATGVAILVELRKEAYGGQYYSLKDPEGHLWSVGSYDPYAPQ